MSQIGFLIKCCVPSEYIRVFIKTLLLQWLVYIYLCGDIMAGVYELDRKITKWWKKFFYHILMICDLNSWILSKDMRAKITFCRFLDEPVRRIILERQKRVVKLLYLAFPVEDYLTSRACILNICQQKATEEVYASDITIMAKRNVQLLPLCQFNDMPLVRIALMLIILESILVYSVLLNKTTCCENFPC